MSGLATTVRRWSGRWTVWLVIVAVLALAVLFMLRLFRPGMHAGIIEYPMLVRTDIPAAIAVAHNGDVWFTMDFADAIGVFRNGRLERIRKPGQNLEPLGLAIDNAGTVWFTEAQTRSVTSLSTDGTTRSFQIPTPIGRFGKLAAARDGSIWFADGASISVTRLKDGVFTPHPVGTDGATPYGVAIDDSGNVWATLQEPDKLLRISANGDMKIFDPPAANSGFGDVAVDGSGAVWFLELGANRIGRFADGHFTDYPLPAQSAGLTGLTIGNDGTVWFTELAVGKIGRIRNGQVREFSLPRARSRPFNVAVDLTGNVWYTDLTGWLGMLPADLAKSR